MTLVAAFRDHDVPVLLGDFLLTRDGQRSGLRRKVHRISSNFVVGWSGDLLAATIVVTALHKRFEGRRVSKVEVEKFLTNYPVENLGRLMVLLCGWIIDTDRCCFLWNSTYPTVLFQDDHHYIGSGATLFERMAGPGNITRDEAGDGDQSTMIGSVLFLTCNLMGDEMSYQDNQRAGFGHAYEVLYWDGTKFRYLDRILYAMTTSFFNTDQKLTDHLLHPVLYRYRSYPYHSRVDTINIIPNPPNPRPTLHTDVHLISAAITSHKLPKEENTIINSVRKEGQDVRSSYNYLCLFFRLAASDHAQVLSGIFPSEDPTFYIRITRDLELTYHHSRSMIEQFYRVIRTDETAER